MGWRVQVNFDDGSEELVDDIFETEDDARMECESWLEGWSAGREVLMLADEPYSDKEIDDFDVWEE